MYSFVIRWYPNIALGLVLCSGLLSTPVSANPLADLFRDSARERVFLEQMLGEPPESGDPLCRVPADESVDPKNTRLRALYGPQPRDLLWQDSDRYDALVAALEELAGDGLDPTLYGTIQLHQWRDLPRSEEHLRTCRDLLASSAYLTALQHLRFGFLPRADLEPLWRDDEQEAKRRRAADEAEFIEVARQGLEEIAAAFHWARPGFADYRQLREAFLAWRDRYRFDDWPRLPPGPVLRPGAEDDRVPLLRQRLERMYDVIDSAEGSAALDPLPDHRYSENLVAAVKDFQRRHGLKVDGVAGPETLAALNLSREFRQDQLRANLERLRWLARELRPDQLLVDIAGARVALFRDGEVVWRGRAQVGTAERETPALSSRITHLTFNPGWTVPPTIYRKDKLPAIRRDIDYLARNRMRVLDREGRELDPADIDWRNPGSIVLRQDPGPNNALGQVAIRFPNPFLVYLHDTPNQQLFESQQRTFSSGCVRVERAPALADLLFAAADGGLLKTIARVRESGATRDIFLPASLPILMAYWTAAADAGGDVAFRPDIYRRDKALIEALREQEEQWRRALAGREPADESGAGKR